MLKVSKEIFYQVYLIIVQINSFKKKEKEHKNKFQDMKRENGFGAKTFALSKAIQHNPQWR